MLYASAKKKNIKFFRKYSEECLIFFFYYVKIKYQLYENQSEILVTYK